MPFRGIDEFGDSLNKSNYGELPVFEQCWHEQLVESERDGIVSLLVYPLILYYRLIYDI